MVNRIRQKAKISFLLFKFHNEPTTSQFDRCGTVRILPIALKKLRSTTTAIFLPHLLSEGTLIWSWGIRRFGPLLL
jgi:hypothetical protein